MLLALVPVLVMYLADVPMGETDRFVYRYTPFLRARLAGVLLVIPALAVVVMALLLLAERGAWRRRAGTVLLILAIGGLALWNWWAPPGPVNQHYFNFLSPSHEGAFVYEAASVQSIAEYLRGFDRRLQRSPTEMRGTRILSNTPGLTVLLAGIGQALPPDPQHPGWLGRLVDPDRAMKKEDGVLAVHALRASVLLAAMWAASGAVAYLLGRRFFSPLGAGAFALLVTFNPATLHFSPGKDAAQLLTINAMLWLWFSAFPLSRVSRDPNSEIQGPALGSWVAGFGLRAGLAGALLLLGMAWGMIHLWVALAALTVMVWHEGLGSGRRRLLRNVLAAAAGGLAVVLLVYATTRWNMLATFWTLNRRYAEVQRTIVLDRRLWLLIGLPIFLLFLSSGFWTFALLAARRRRARGGGVRALPLGIATAVVLGLTYLVGVTYELPRLWIAFLPLLMLAAMAGQPLLSAPPRRRAAIAVATIVGLSLLASAVHWSFLDVRESEYRLSRKLYFH